MTLGLLLTLLYYLSFKTFHTLSPKNNNNNNLRLSMPVATTLIVKNFVKWIVTLRLVS